MTPTITTQTVVTKEKVNLSLDMNTDLFWTYIKQRFNKDFANLVCHELNFFVPIAFNSVENLDSLKKYIDRRLEKLDANSIKIYFEHEGDCQSKLIMNNAYLMVLDNFREEITQLINKKKKPFGGVTFSDSTDTSTDNHKMRSKKRKSEIGDTRERVQRRRRQNRPNKHSRDEWSFSSDEYVAPTSAEVGPSCNFNDRYDYDLYTIGRLDYFCCKHFVLKTATEIRKFQHRAQCRLQMHQENLYEYFKFMRNSRDIMLTLENYVSEKITSSNDDENNLTKIDLIIDKLIDIKKSYNFVNFSE
ncbi:unnamed protein product [Rotaria socialis]|uniref:Uncharacterized protein n=2 Tax=Rotaria socialis TaxID=392032 RepID=A0A818KL22_9BILA|nr:unnamed protein product [Rotaria socialis]CAF3445355.1 unnamed protein product [Rotaria socialis]CAF3450004.1 unnamed protein product [Rotaria socialis]CAF3556019.1 unnamed protein product [Rotaria socialis]CAF4453038.1 unnamed protein product [Rotaria socialis]